MPGGYGYSYGGPNTKREATGSMGSGAKGMSHSARKGSLGGGSPTYSDPRYTGMESPMFLDADEHGEERHGPWPHGKKKGKTTGY